MANVPIVTEVTKAQLDALVAANGLNEGLQYKVTDKGWLLIATGNNTYLVQQNKEVRFKIYRQAGNLLCMMSGAYTGYTITATEDAQNKRWIITPSPLFDPYDSVLIMSNNSTPMTQFISGVIVGGGPDAGKIYVTIIDYLGAYKGGQDECNSLNLIVYPNT